METDDWAERMRALAPFAFAPGVDGELLRGFIEKKSADVQDLDGYRAQIAAVLSHDTYDRLPQIRRPTLIVTGDSDRVIGAPSSEVLHERIPDSRLEVIDDAGHLFFIEQPDQTVELLDRFLARRPGGPGQTAAIKGGPGPALQRRRVFGAISAVRLDESRGRAPRPGPTGAARHQRGSGGVSPRMPSGAARHQRGSGGASPRLPSPSGATGSRPRSGAFTSTGSPRSGNGISILSKSRGTTVFSNAARASSRTSLPP